MDLLRQVLMDPLLRNIATTIVLLVAVLGARALVVRAIKGADLPYEVRLRWLVNVRMVALVILLVGVVGVWATEVRTIALSLFAVAVAVVIATKELILCLSGAILRSGAKAFSVGDRIQVGDVRGDVIFMRALSTTLLEVGPGPQVHRRTGRIVVIPNSSLINKPLFNETSAHDVVLHVLTVPLEMKDNWKSAEDALIRACHDECSEFLEEAGKQMARFAADQGLDAPNVEPKVSLQLPDPGKITLHLRFPVPVKVRGRVEQAILRRYLFIRAAEPKCEPEIVDEAQNGESVP